MEESHTGNKLFTAYSHRTEVSDILSMICNEIDLSPASGSMQFSFYDRGDLLFVTNYPEDLVRAGDVVVFRIENYSIPIVHRVMRVHER